MDERDYEQNLVLFPAHPFKLALRFMQAMCRSHGKPVWLENSDSPTRFVLPEKMEAKDFLMAPWMHGFLCLVFSV